MTTIAWDGRMLAADRRAVMSNMPREVRKLFVSKHWAYAGAGMLRDVETNAAWFAAGAPPDALPELEDGGVTGLAVQRATGRCFIVEGLRPKLCLVNERFTATGSGRDFAIAAMALGKSAREAVLLASRFDVATGDGVDVFRFTGRRKQ